MPPADPPEDAALRYLRLLADDADVGAFELPTPAEDTAALARAEQARTYALRVRAALEQRRSREHALRALVDSAEDLAARRDVDSLLSALVRRARQLLGTDITYLTLNDSERGDTYMRETDGSVSARFQRLRLGLGEGLGGLVAQTMTPYASANYPQDERFNHTGSIDGAVQEEGLVAICGVPLMLARKNLGVLFAANRTERPFDREEVALLSSLADHAAVALDSARLLEETQTALAELEVAGAELASRGEAVERAADAHDRFARLVLHGAGLHEVALAVTEVLGGALLVFDEQGRVLADVGSPVPDPDSDVDGVAVLAAARSTPRTLRVDRSWVAAVSAGSDLMGALALCRDGDLSGSDQRILERAALVSALVMLIDRSSIEAENRVRGELLGELLSAPDADPDRLRERARRVGADLDRSQVALVVDVRGSARDRAAAAAAHLSARRGGLAGWFESRLVLVLPHGDPALVSIDVQADLTVNGITPTTVGAAAATPGPAGVAAAHAEAARCVDALIALGRGGQAASAADLGFVGLLMAGEPDVSVYVARVLGPVLDYDGRRGTQLVATLEAYFAVGGVLARAAERLHVHVNTVTQRLERIGGLLGVEWAQPEHSLEVQLALRLFRVAG